MLSFAMWQTYPNGVTQRGASRPWRLGGQLMYAQRSTGVHATRQWDDLSLKPQRNSVPSVCSVVKNRS